MKEKNQLSRRTSLKSMGALGAAAFLGSQARPGAPSSALAAVEGVEASDVRKQIAEKVSKTSLVDTHEHLPAERERLASKGLIWIECDDWAVLIGGYLESDLLTAGMSPTSKEKLFSANVDPIKKWTLIEPYWPAVKNTGYGLAARISIEKLYGVSELSAKTVRQVQAGYEKTRVSGFYKRILHEVANIESCQVNSLTAPFEETGQPTLLMQDLGIVGMITRDPFEMPGWASEVYRKPTGIEVKSLSDWHKVIDWWFGKYSRYAVAVKSQHAYVRDIDFAQVPPEKAEGLFKKQLDGEPLTDEEQKTVEDHLFWYAVKKATENDLPVKLHTGYYAGENKMPLSRLINNAGSACDLCRVAPDTKFVFMHICYPYYEELISVAKQYTNAYLDMCWAWIINPIAAKDFLKKYLVTAPANKILTFGADYLFVENVVGHAVMARQGITQALSELVEEGWMSLGDALELVEPIMHGNARHLFNLKGKEKALKRAPWA